MPSAEQTGVQSKVEFGRLDRGRLRPPPLSRPGFPRFKLRAAPDQPEIRLRDVHYATGSISAGSNVKTGTFEFAVAVTPADTGLLGTLAVGRDVRGSGVRVGPDDRNRRPALSGRIICEC